MCTLLVATQEAKDGNKQGPGEGEQQQSKKKPGKPAPGDYKLVHQPAVRGFIWRETLQVTPGTAPLKRPPESCPRPPPPRPVIAIKLPLFRPPPRPTPLRVSFLTPLHS